jgi:hypothetical protein
MRLDVIPHDEGASQTTHSSQSNFELYRFLCRINIVLPLWICVVVLQ